MKKGVHVLINGIKMHITCIGYSQHDETGVKTEKEVWVIRLTLELPCICCLPRLRYLIGLVLYFN